MGKSKRNPKLYECELLERVNMLSITERILFYYVSFVFKCIHKSLGGNYVKTFFMLKATGRLRSSSRNILVDVFKNASYTYDNSIRARAIKHWNSLPADIAVFNIGMNTFKSSIGNYIVKNRLRNNTSQYIPP